jgi:hypothetical protein
MSGFSRRNEQPIERYSFGISQQVRNRVMMVFQSYQVRTAYEAAMTYSFIRFLGGVRNRLLSRYGTLKARVEFAQDEIHQIQKHLSVCNDDEFIDFVETAFLDSHFNFTPDGFGIIEELNEIFEQEGLGYELSTQTPETISNPTPAMVFGGAARGRTQKQTYVKVLRKDERSKHEVAVLPALQALSHPLFRTAQKELGDAFDAMKRGSYADAVTACGSSFESVMKTICQEKGWPYSQNDACSKLVKVCKDGGLFHGFYAPIFEGVGTVRNKIGDAHGKGAAPEFHPANREEADHMIAMTCSHIAFLIKQAGH